MSDGGVVCTAWPHCLRIGMRHPLANPQCRPRERAKYGTRGIVQQRLPRDREGKAWLMFQSGGRRQDRQADDSPLRERSILPSLPGTPQTRSAAVGPSSVARMTALLPQHRPCCADGDRVNSVGTSRCPALMRAVGDERHPASRRFRPSIVPDGWKRRVDVPILAETQRRIRNGHLPCRRSPVPELLKQQAQAATIVVTTEYHDALGPTQGVQMFSWIRIQQH